MLLLCSELGGVSTPELGRDVTKHWLYRGNATITNEPLLYTKLDKVTMPKPGRGARVGNLCTERLGTSDLQGPPYLHGVEMPNSNPKSRLNSLSLDSSAIELRSLQSPNITGISSNETQIGLRAMFFVSGQVIKIHNFKKYPDASRIKLIGFRAQSSELGHGLELLKLGFKVRARVQSAQRAESLLQAEEVLLTSGLPYTIARPGGMERPTDAYKETHNITLSLEDTLFGGKLMAFMAKNRSLSYCKVVEVVAETTAPFTPMGELLRQIPSQRVEIKPLKKPLSTPVEKEPATEISIYEDLEPPTSPSPTPSTSARATQVDSSKLPIEKKAVGTEEKTSPVSPYTTYDDLRPATSPSPNAQNGSLLPPLSSNGGSQMATAVVNNTPQALPTYNPGDESHQAEPKPTPLSPFTM
ncbi:NAD(P)-binding Rossmann-fold superfamily protein [Actinidia rufa]|uniref:NAD(P)-binding Rossmann-fold superfamily protein n=1 Tax=Actinidia rufa TaxID=165716 RepID=A0A7J0DJ31_9ERIC|nr:NAD(P)-binding Rossmann-fold superfamily protein [Actinidia rufa]